MPDVAKRKRHKLPGFTSSIPTVPASLTLAETQSYLLSHTDQFDTIDYVYVTAPDGRLIGVFSIKEMYHHPPSASVASVCQKPPLVTATVATDQEEIAYLALRHGIKAVPVVDEHGKLLGVVPHDGVNRILYRELREDILHLAGVTRGHAAVDNIFEIPLIRSVRHRLPWLVIGTLGGLAIAQIIGQFERTLSDNLILAAFIPLVVYIADAVGTQMEAFVIRDFALFRKLDFARYFVRHLLVVLAIAVIIGSLVALAALVFYRRFDMALVLGLAVAGSTISALFSGLVVPLVFRKMNVDPANASGPLGTILQDASSVIIYLSIARLVL